jgi:hypothetical protein
MPKETLVMFDLFCVGLTLLFFVVAALFVAGCEALEKEED